MLVVRDLSHQFLLHGRPRVLFHDLSFVVEKGERVAILGRNGQGKSTLIKLLGGILGPTAGSITWTMSASWPLAFSGGFQGSLTGLDNILFISRIYSKPAAEIIKRTESFAELGPALTQPIKYYSSGMRARLAFGLSIAIDFDCYLIDEIIAVGDASFQEKSQKELFGRNAHRTFIIATHDFNFVREMCDRAIVIESGEATLFDSVEPAIEAATAYTDREPVA